MIEQFPLELPRGISLSCRAAGPEGAPLLVFLHGFPEAAFVWDGLLARFSDRYRCVAPNLRGYERSSAPQEPQAYRGKHLVQDISALIDRLGGKARAVIAHDWGGAVAWSFAALHPAQLDRLVIINAPHPATLLRELQHNPRQQAASAYMRFLCRPDAERLLIENDFARLWGFFTGQGPDDASQPRAPWLTDSVKEQYRAVWRAGLQGPLNYYRASPLQPPTSADDAVMRLQLPDDIVSVRVPTQVVWAEGDTALLPGLLDGLQRYVPQLSVSRIARATHWVIHEQPQRIAEEIERSLGLR